VLRTGGVDVKPQETPSNQSLGRDDPIKDRPATRTGMSAMPRSLNPEANGTAGAAGFSRRALLRGAGVSGAAVLLAGAASVVTAAPTQASVQTNWRWCAQCQGLWFAGNGPLNKPCPIAPSSQVHTSAGSGNYKLLQGKDAFGQLGWSHCLYCQGQWYTRNSTNGVCPKRGAALGHSWQGSGSYGMVSHDGIFGGPGQGDWYWCHKCQGLWHFDRATRNMGFCPAGGGHSFDGSREYGVEL
jgi:hypothetical protein